jgi:hypothetical protein
LPLGITASFNFTAVRSSKQILIWSTLLLVSLLHACTKPKNFDADIRAADSLKTHMDETLALIDTSVLQIADSIELQLNYIQSNYQGEMERTMAQTFIRFSDIRDNLSLLDQWRDSLHNRQDKIENELMAFRNALADKATHDGLNREINELYADTVMQHLIEKEQQWHTKVNEWLQQQKSLYNNWSTLNDTILIWRQSIPKQNSPA